MQFDQLRAFPYPVLRPYVDDYVDSDIQVTVDFETTAEGMDVSCTVLFTISVPEITALVTSGSARYVVVFACRDTYYRHVARSAKSEFKVKFERGHLRGEVQVFPYVVAQAPISGFKSKHINTEFGKGPFSFETGSVLAVDRPQQIYIDRDAFKPITSIFALVKDPNLTGYDWRINAESNRVLIKVSGEAKERIDLARNTKANKAVLINSIYFSAVTHCISLLRTQADVFSDLSWARIIVEKCENAGIDIEQHDDYYVAQVLMETPFRLVEAHVFGKEAG